MKVKVLDTSPSELGEGIFVDSNNAIIYWVDIISSEIYQYDIINEKLIKKFSLNLNPSSILSIERNNLIYLDCVGLKKLDLKSGSTFLVCEYPEHDSSEFRANDGAFFGDKELCYGTMNKNCVNNPGKIYYHKGIGDLPIVYDFNINIPNTFIGFENKVLISDSLKGIIYQVTDLGGRDINVTPWMDFSNEVFTPDGGCLSKNGFIHIAIWDGSAIIVLNKNANVVCKIDLPVLRPTNCTFFRDRWLCVTSAREGMTFEELQKYPLSGRTFMIDLGSNYEY